MSSQGSPEMWKSGSPDEVPDKLTSLKVNKKVIRNIIIEFAVEAI
jgi:hypothetical protein